MTARRFIKECIGDLFYLLACGIGLTMAFFMWMYREFCDLSPRFQGFLLGFLSFGAMIIVMGVMFAPGL